MAKRPTNADGTPWWVSSGPPQRNEPTVSEQLHAEATREEPQEATQQEATQQEIPNASFLGIAPEVQSAALATGLGLLTSVIDLVSKPLAGETQTSTHDPAACGVCPLCVAVAAVREHDAGLADLIESAMSGVTGSMEKLSGMLPDVADRVTEALVSAALKAMLHRS